MAKDYSAYEEHIITLFNNCSSIIWKNKEFDLISACKPRSQGGGGEPKTDVYVLLKNTQNNHTDIIKISVKQDNAEFLANKLDKFAAENLLGKDWQDILIKSISTIKNKFLSKEIVAIKPKKGDTEAQDAFFTLGWKLEITNRPRTLSAQLLLSKKEIINIIYKGTAQYDEKRDSIVFHHIEKNSGIAEYLLEGNINKHHSVQSVLADIKLLDAYDPGNIYLAFTANNYRLKANSADGPRTLAVSILWTTEGKYLHPTFQFETPLEYQGETDMMPHIKNSLNILNIHKVDDIRVRINDICKKNWPLNAKNVKISQNLQGIYMQPNIISLFAGAGGLDLGFKNAGFNIIWANEFDKSIWDTHEFNFPECPLDKRSIVLIPSSEIPDAIGIIGGPPCQSWSEAGSRKGINDARGKLFHEYIRVLKDKKPLFFLAENVSGILHAKHHDAFQNILKEFENAGYEISYERLNAHDYNVPQDRLRVIIVGFHKSLNKKFTFPKEIKQKKYLFDAIADLKETAKPATDKNKANIDLDISNHEYMTGGFSSIFMSRNRVRKWDEPSFTIQASGRHAPIHPQAPKMQKVETNKFEFCGTNIDLYRRLSVRECARIQTFPDNFIFKYQSVNDGYKMVGNAVPVNFAYHLAAEIYRQLDL